MPNAEQQPSIRITHEDVLEQAKSDLNKAALEGDSEKLQEIAGDIPDLNEKVQQEEEKVINFDAISSKLEKMLLSPTATEEERQLLQEQFEEARLEFFTGVKTQWAPEQRQYVLNQLKEVQKLLQKLQATPASEDEEAPEQEDDSGKDGEPFANPPEAEELQAFITEVRQEVDEIIEKLATDYDPTDPDDRKMVDERVGQIKQDLETKIDAIRQILSDYNVKTPDPAENRKRREFVTTLTETYLESPELEEIKENLTKAELELWITRLEEDFPQFKEAREYVESDLELDSSNAQASVEQARERVDHALEQVAAINNLQSKLEQDDERRKHIEVVLAGLREKITEEEHEIFEFWKDNLPELYSELDPGTADTFAHLLQELPGRMATATLDELRDWLTALNTRVTTVKEQVETSRGVRMPLADSAYSGVYTEELQKLWDQAQELTEQIEGRVKSETEIQNALTRVERIREDLASMEKQEYDYNPMEASGDYVSKAYEQVYRRFEQLRDEGVLTREQLKDLEAAILASEYRHRRKAFFLRFKKVEGQNMGLGDLTTVYNGIEANLVNRMESIVLRLEEIDKLNGFQRDIKDIKMEFGNRKSAHLSWAAAGMPILGEGGRDFPKGDISTDIFTLGDTIQSYIREGVRDDEFGETTNPILGTREVEVKSPENSGSTETIKFEETAMGYLFRRFDRIYQGEDPSVVGKDGVPINSQNLHDNSEALIAYLWQEEKNRSGGPRFDENTILRAFRAHMLLTLNHSYLAPPSGRATIPDKLYYRMHWWEYASSYDLAGTNAFEPLITYLLYTTRDKATGKKDNILEAVFGKGGYLEGYNKIRGAMEENGFLDKNPKLKEEWGFEHFGFLLQPLFGMENVGSGVRQGGKDVGKPRTNILTMEPPLRHHVLYNNQLTDITTENGTPLVNPPEDDEEPKPIRYNVSGGTGKMVTFDDLRDVNGDRLYELMPLDFIGPSLLSYYNHMKVNGGNFLDNVLKADRQDVRAKLGTSNTLASMKNQDKYLMSLLPIVGNEIKYNKDKGKEVGKAVMNQIILMLVLAKVLVETDPSNDDPWSFSQIRKYLDKMSGDGVIPYEGADAVYTMVEAGMKFRVRLFSALHKFQDQLEKRFTYTA